MSNTCFKCHCTVYVNEQVKSSNARPFHKSCFRCSACRISLVQGKDHELEGNVFCKSCHSKQRLSSDAPFLKDDAPLFASQPLMATLEEEAEVGEQKEEETPRPGVKTRRSSSRDQERERRLSESVWFHQSLGD
ncbi:hypothetical protein BASA81_003290 [Batrachochytrium salamandrivorans]|nr:hypothetical protein BASA81_003290 [Batrachochytrium salamandrivorans]